MMRVAVSLVVLILWFWPSQVKSQTPEACCNPGTGACGNGQCEAFDEYDQGGTSHFCVESDMTTHTSCSCPTDTCRATCQHHYYYSHPPEWECSVGCISGACDWTGCAQYTGFGYPSSGSVTYQGFTPLGPFFCYQALRASLCNGNGDYGSLGTALVNTNPFATIASLNGHCECDCGFTSSGNCAGPQSTTSTQCLNPGTRVLTTMVAVTYPYGGAPGCTDPGANLVTCWCPQDTCSSVSGGSITCGCVDGACYTNNKYYDTVRNKGFVFCGDPYRTLICNNHGDSSSLSGISPIASTDGSANCLCDCGYSGRFCLTAQPTTCGSSFSCTNPATGNLATFNAPCMPPTYWTCSDGNSNVVPCWCPSDTCSLVTSSGSPAAPYAQCNTINGVGYIGEQYFAANRGANVAVFCSMSFRTVVCNGHGDSLLQTGIPWNAYFKNNMFPFYQNQAPCQCDNGWFNTASDNQCNIFVTCPSPRPGQAPAGAGMCGFTGWNAPDSQGYCLQSGDCQCLNGWSGTACDSFCPTNNNQDECSGMGTCNMLTNPFAFLAVGKFGEGGALYSFYQVANQPLVSVAAALEQYAMAALFQTNPYAPYTPVYGSQIQAACAAGEAAQGPPAIAAAEMIACYQSMMQFFFNDTVGVQFEAFQIERGYNGTSMTGMVSDMFAAYYGFLTPDPSWIQSSALPHLFANPATQASALALFLSYEQFVDFTSVGFSAPYPSFSAPIWKCDCGTGEFSAPSGPDCAASCPSQFNSGGTQPACGGMSNGQPNGQCVTTANTCDCARNFVGPTCTTSLAGKCFDDTTVGTDQICSGSSHGSCNVTTVSTHTGTQTFASCDCANTWTGQFCDISRCSMNTTECSHHGTCTQVTGHGFQCVCQTPTATTQTPTPPIWAGTYCEVNAAAQCGYFIPNQVGAGGTWTTCFNHGSFSGNQCVRNSTGQFNCVCTGGQFGQFCQLTSCSPACSSTEVCNGQSGTCSCQPMWNGPTCTNNLCGNGVPNPTGTACLCNPYYRVDSSGHCTITQCPLVFSTSTGVRACNYHIDVNCTNPELGTPQAGCCWDACGQGSTSECSVNGGQPTCGCDTTLYNQTGGICYSRCNGQPDSVVNGHYKCDCSAVSPGPNQWVNQTDCSLHSCQNGGHPASCQCQCVCDSPPWTGADCSISECVNGGTPSLNGCSCPVMWGGPACSVGQCQNGGVPSNNGTACQCPSKWGGPMCHTNLCNNGGTPNTQGTLCNCPTPYSGPFCTNNTCLHGGTPSGSSCSCPYPYTGTNCASNVCTHGGIVVNQTCSCPFPYTGSTCSANLCQNGGTVSGSICSCPSGFSGSECQTVTSCNNGGVYHSNNHTCTCPSVWGGLTCLNSLCQHGGTPLSNGRACTNCQAAWGGQFCTIELCEHSGTPTSAGTACTCPFPYSGILCASNQCLHGGTPSGSRCMCSVPWTGTTCNTNACQNGGAASTDNTRCVCVGGFSGEFCQNGPTSSSSTGTSTPPSTSSSPSLNTAAIAGIAVGSTAAVAGIGVGVYYMVMAIRKTATGTVVETGHLLSTTTRV